MEFLAVWSMVCYAVFVFVAERFSPFPPDKLSVDQYGPRSRRRRLGYWFLAGLAAIGIIVELLFSPQSIAYKSMIAMGVGVLLCLPGLSVYLLRKRAARTSV